MENQSQTLVESTAFMAGMTALGGFCNAYTCVTRGGVFANAHTANMAKLGISLATFNWVDAWGAVVPILSCLAGGVLCELVKDKGKGGTGILGGNWYKKAMVIELLVLILVGFIPNTVPHAWVNALMSLATGFQLNIFRNWKYGGHNTTICTGNLRNLAQWTYAAMTQRNQGMTRKMLAYGVLLLSFTLGAALSALLSFRMGVQASWAGALLLLIWLVWLIRDEESVMQTTPIEP